jgi:PAS domain-containing protein
MSSRPAADLLQELSALKQRAAEIERQLGLDAANNTSAPSDIPLRSAFKKALAEWRRTFDALELPMAVLDGEGRVLRLNRAGQALAGHPLEHLQFQRLVDLALPTPWPEAAEFLETVLRDPTACATQIHDVANGRTWDLSICPDDTEPVENARIILVMAMRAGSMQ